MVTLQQHLVPCALLEESFFPRLYEKVGEKTMPTFVTQGPRKRIAVVISAFGSKHGAVQFTTTTVGTSAHMEVLRNFFSASILNERTCGSKLSDPFAVSHSTKGGRNHQGSPGLSHVAGGAERLNAPHNQASWRRSLNFSFQISKTSASKSIYLIR